MSCLISVSAAAQTENGERVGFPSLQQAVELSRQNAPDVVSARAGVRVARSSYLGAKLSSFGNPYVEVWMDRAIDRNATRDVTIQTNLWFPVDLGSQRANRIGEADALVNWQESSVTAVRAKVTADTVRAYGAAIVAENKLETLRAIEITWKAQSDYYYEKLQVGAAVEQDEKLARLELVRTQVSIEEAKADLARALAQLALLTGKDFQSPTPSNAAHPPEITSDKKSLNELPVVTEKHAFQAYQLASSKRWASESVPPFNFILTMGRGDLGETRIGGAVAWTLPFMRVNQAEKGRALAEAERASNEAQITQQRARTVIDRLNEERKHVQQATVLVNDLAEPAAEAAVRAATEVAKAGKGQMLQVYTAQRELSLTRLRKLDLLSREWTIFADSVALTGELP